MTKHIHAENMLLYAQDAMETDKPWLRWRSQYQFDQRWYQCSGHPTWRVDVIYERIPQTMNINGFEVPMPLRESSVYKYPIYRVNYGWFGSLTVEEHFKCTPAISIAIKLGLVHATKEAAILHGKALASFFSKEKPE